METTASDRVQVVSQGELLHPGACSLCGSGNSDEGYVNMGIWYEYEGQQYYCMNCVNQIISTVGGLTADEAGFINNLNEELVSRNASLTTELEEANGRNAKWMDVISSISDPDATSVDPFVDASTSLNEAEPVTHAKPEVSEPKPVEDESKPSKPVEGKRPPKPRRPATDNGEFDL